MESSQFLSSVVTIHAEAERRGLFFRTVSDARLRGRTVTIDGREVTSWSSCSYLGLELHPEVIAGVHDAVDRYGAQFSCSRGYLSAPLYAEVEARLEQLFEAHVLVTPSTTLAHQIALPVLATEKDAIVVDHQAHHSVQMAATIARGAGTTVELVRHSDEEKALETVRRLSQRHRTVWFAGDGVYSMYGDLAPIGFLRRVLAVAPNVRLYVDDAHGMSWAGRHGRGSFLSRFPLTERVVVATSFAKGFGAGGGCVVFADAAERDRVRMSGGPFVFSGPMQPPMLGAVAASARVHLSPEIGPLQEALAARVDHVNRRLQHAGIPPLAVNESPIVFLPLGAPKVAFEVAERMLRDGVYVNVSAYPTVPMHRAGIRFTITATHSFAQIDWAIDRLAVHVPAVLAEAGISEHARDEAFAGALPVESASTPRPGPRLVPPPPAARLQTQVASTIREVDRAEWDAALGTAAACSWDALVAMESVFHGETAETDWRYSYVLVRDAARRLVAATFFTTLLNKDDMLSREEVSREVEALRREDPSFLTSRVVMMGSNLSEGRHLWLDRTGPWREALAAVLEAASTEMRRSGATAVILRDLPTDDAALDGALLDAGYARMPMLDSHVLELDPTEPTWEASWLDGLSRRSRRHVKTIVAEADAFETRTHQGEGALAPAEIDHLYRLYRNVADRKLKLNIFPYPASLLPALLANPAWELVTLHVRPEAGGLGDGRPVAFYAAHRHADEYAPLFCGLDYEWLASHGIYRQLIWGMVQRARALGMRRVHMGMDADLEKQRFGAIPVANCVFVQASDHWNGAVLRDIVERVALRQAG